jgi:hypothetical protein
MYFFLNPLKQEIVFATFKNSVRTSKRTPHFTNINWLMLFKEIIAVYIENYSEPVSTKYNLLVVKATGTVHIG